MVNTNSLETVCTNTAFLYIRFPEVTVFADFLPEPLLEIYSRYIISTLEGKFDDKLTCRKRLGRKLSDYQHNVPPHVRTAKLADE